HFSHTNFDYTKANRYKKKINYICIYIYICIVVSVLLTCVKCVHMISSVIMQSEMRPIETALLQSWITDSVVPLQQKICLDVFTEVLTTTIDHSTNATVDNKWLLLLVTDNNERQTKHNVMETKFMLKVIDLIVSKDLDLSQSALRFLRVVIQCCESHHWSLLVDKLLKRSKGSVKYYFFFVVQKKKKY
ncbi:hypothetical protein RFI_04507, partial [Reticulomyxa filosa]